MPRITTGKAKNKNFKVPEVPEIRAVQDVVKLAVFSMLGDKVADSQCLDLYAGSGSFGLEALSRGAEWCDFVDTHYKAIGTLMENLKDLQFTNAEVFKQDAVKYVANTHKKYDLIFVDPFYEDIKHKFLLKNLEEILAGEGTIVFAHGKDLNLAEQIEGTGLKISDERRFGKSFFTMLHVS